MITLRAVDDRDVFRLYRWQQHPGTRQFAHNRSTPTWDGHLQYFLSRYPDEDWLIGEVEGHAVGTISLHDVPGHGGRWISIVIAPESRGQGFGAPLLATATRHWAGKELFADVHENNGASQRVFHKAGYVQQWKRGPWLVFRPGGLATNGKPTSERRA